MTHRQTAGQIIAKRILLMVLLMGLSGCAVFNPYESDFKCPKLENGKCVDVATAYAEATGAISLEAPAEQEDCINCPSSKDRGDFLPEEQKYQEGLYQRMETLVKEPVTPIVAPAEYQRVWFPPYQGRIGELYMERHVYFKTEDPRFVLGEYLVREDQGL